MPLFSYKARTSTGELAGDRIEAENEKAAAAKLQALGLFPVEIELLSGRKTWFGALRPSGKSIPRGEIVLFTSRLADLLKGGLQLSRALGVLERQTENKRLASVIGGFKDGVLEGKSFSDKLGEHPKYFSKTYVGIVRAGESAGMLESVLVRLAEFGEKEEELRHKIQAALAYPAIMLAVGLASVVFILAFVIPKFQLMFMEMGQLLPLPTRILIAASSVIKKGWWVYIPIAAAAFIVIKKQLGTEKGRNAFDRMLLSLPLIGDLVKKEQIARSIRTLSALLKNGVPILDALVMAEESTGNSVLVNEFKIIQKSVKEGGGLVEPLRASKVFPPMVADMVAIGEETGGLESALLRVATAYEREVDYSVKTLTSMLEPAIILIIGAVVGFVAISMLMPIFQMSAVVR